MSDSAPQDLSALQNAWQRFATYDHNASVTQRRFYRLRVTVLAVGLAAIALAIVYDELIEVQSKTRCRPPIDDWQFWFWLAMISAPILGGVLAAGVSRFARGVDWTSLRGAAEAIKREIYLYRCKVGIYGPGSTRDQRLAAAVGDVTTRLMDTEVLNASLNPYREQLPPRYATPEEDDGFSDLVPARYFEWRLNDQLAYFRGKSRQLDRRHQVLQWSVAGLGGVGTLLAAVGYEIWVPVSVGLGTALVSYLELRNVATNLAGYNRAALELDNVATWWSGLPEDARSDPASFATMVDRTEAILGSENASWVQEMQKAIDELEDEDSEG